MPEVFGAGNDFSANSLTVAGLLSAGNVLLGTGTISYRGFIYIQNQSSSVLYLALDSGAGDTNPVTILCIDPGAGPGRQGGSIDPIPWFTGRVRVYGPSGAEYAGRSY